MYIFICIGSTKIIGDSLGPITGTLLKERYKNNSKIKVYGDVINQIDFYNVDIIFNEIISKYDKNSTKIIIDSALGDKIGNFEVSNGKIYLGKGLNKNKVINLTDSDEAARQLALALYGPIFLLYSVYDGAADKAPVLAQADRHLERFTRSLQAP